MGMFNLRTRLLQWQANYLSRPMPLASYKAAVALLPPPTPLQMQQFSEHVSQAHSWYKHLPLLPPGRPFQFYLDPGAGLDLEVKPGGTLEAKARLERGFHYSWLPTAEYRQKFGYLAFSQSSGTAVSMLHETGAQTVPTDFDCRVFDPRMGITRPVPLEILQAGRSFVSGIVHPASIDSRLLLYTIHQSPHVDWPPESGGNAAWEKIIARCHALHTDPSQHKARSEADNIESVRPSHRYGSVVADKDLHEALEPERKRQRVGMIAAMVRVVKLVHPDYV